MTDLFLDSVLQLPLLPFDIAVQIDLQVEGELAKFGQRVWLRYLLLAVSRF